MDVSISLASLILLVLALVKAVDVVLRSRNSRNSKLPPGPRRLPVIGNLFDLGDKPHKSLATLAKTYGPLMSLKLGNATTVVITSTELAKEVLQKQDSFFADRPVPDAVTANDHAQYSLPFSPVTVSWRNLRRICNSYIFTSQKLDSNQELRNGKIREMVAEIQKSCDAGEAIDIGQLVFKATLNVISNVVFSLNLTDSRSDLALEFKKIVSCIMDEIGKPNTSDYFPIFRRFDPQGIRRRMKVLSGKVFDIFDQIIDDRLLLRKSEGYVTANDMLDTLLTISEQNGDDMDRNRIKHLILDIFAAGTDTTSITAEWTMTELLRNPKTLMKARSELEQAVGRGKFLQESDIAKLPYVQAVIKETFRLHPPAPFLIPHKAKADIEMRGFTIPKGAQVLVNIWAMGRDPKLWEDPTSFKPERFLNSDIDVRGHSFELIPFGAGRRICPGLPMVTRVLPMLLGSLIHSFDWRLEDGIKPESIDMEERFGLTLQKAKSLRAIPIRE